MGLGATRASYVEKVGGFRSLANVVGNTTALRISAVHLVILCGVVQSFACFAKTM